MPHNNNDAPAGNTATTPTFAGMITRIWHGCLYGVGLGLILGLLIAKIFPVMDFGFTFLAVFTFVLIASIRQDITFMWSAPTALAGFIGKIFLFIISVWGFFSLAGMVTGTTFGEFWLQFSEADGLLGLFDSSKTVPPDVGIGLLILGLAAWLAISVLVTKTVSAKTTLLLCFLVFVAIVIDEKFAGGTTKLLPEQNAVNIEVKKLRADAAEDFRIKMEKLRHQRRQNPAITTLQFDADALAAKQELVKSQNAANSLLDSEPPQMQPPPQQSALPAPMPTPSAPTIPGTQVTSIGANKWEVTFPANLEFRTDIPIPINQKAVFSGWTGAVKLNPGDSYTSPPSGGFPTEKMKFKTPTGEIQILPREFWVQPEAWTGALLARVDGQDYTDVGSRVSNSFLAVTAGKVILSVNCLKDERNNATGILHGIIEVQ